MTELRIRVKPIVKERLELLKEKMGLDINGVVNWALVKFMITEGLIKFWEYENVAKKDPHYENINKLPEDLKFCDGDSCEIDYDKYKGNRKELVDWNERGEKC